MQELMEQQSKPKTSIPEETDPTRCQNIESDGQSADTQRAVGGHRKTAGRPHPFDQEGEENRAPGKAQRNERPKKAQGPTQGQTEDDKTQIQGKDRQLNHKDVERPWLTATKRKCIPLWKSEPKAKSEDKATKQYDHARPQGSRL
jgi:hypothetical protein